MFCGADSVYQTSRRKSGRCFDHKAIRFSKVCSWQFRHGSMWWRSTVRWRHVWIAHRCPDSSNSLRSSVFGIAGLDLREVIVSVWMYVSDCSQVLLSSVPRQRWEPVIIAGKWIAAASGPKKLMCQIRKRCTPLAVHIHNKYNDQDRDLICVSLRFNLIYKNGDLRFSCARHAAT